MTEDVIAELRLAEPKSEFHKTLLEDCKNLIKMSRCEMAKNYSSWDQQDMIVRGIRCEDKEDIEAAKRDKPIKMVVPSTYAQVMTFTSFIFLLYNQNRNFYELLPTGDEDFGKKRSDCELILDRDVKRNEFNNLIFQDLFGLARFGLSITECCWTRDIVRAFVTPDPGVATFQSVEVPVREGSQWQEVVKYEGNLVRTISPYRFFPDTRFPLVDFRKGEFCGGEEEYSKSQLYKLEAAGEVAGIDQIQPLPRNWETGRGAVTRTMMQQGTRYNGYLQGPSKVEGTVLVTKLQRWIVPSKYTFGPKDTKLGPEEFPILYHVWYANDTRLIRLEPAYWWHNEFGWAVSQFTPDMHHTVSTGLADLIYRLQDVITWLINARITDVRRNIRGRYLVNPSLIDTKSLDGEGDVYLRKGASAMDLSRGAVPLPVQDVTRTHMTDADLLGKVMEVVTGVNSNAMGQYSSGRRSARQTDVVTAGSSGRMKMHAQLIWETGPGRIGRLMLSNSRQSLSFDQFARVIGQVAPDVQERYVAFKGTPEEVICGSDYFTFDSTLSSEKGFIAQALQELLIAVIGNPLAAQQLDIDPRTLLAEIQYLRGVGNVSRFSLSRQMAAGAPPLPPVVVPAATGTGGLPV